MITRELQSRRGVKMFLEHGCPEIMNVGRLISISPSLDTDRGSISIILIFLIIRQKQMLFVGTEPNKTCRKLFFFGVFLERGPLG